MNAAPEKSLRDVTARTFLFLSTFRASSESSEMEAREAAEALRAVWREEEAEARTKPELWTAYERAKPLLVITADELMRTAPGWFDAASWPSMEAEFYGTAVGGESFFEKVEDPTYQSPELVEVAFHALALGFQGMHAGDARTLSDLRRRLRHRLDGVPSDQSERITPEAYEHTQGEDYTTMPVASSLRLFVVLAGVVLVLGLLARVAYGTSVSRLISATDAIASPQDGLGD